MKNEHHVRHFLAAALMLIALVGLVPLAVAMVPGPVEEDDIPPLPEPEPIFAPETVIKLPKTVQLTDYANYPEHAYARCLSIGLPNRGALRGGVLFPRNTPYYTATRPDRQWATPETVDALLYAAKKVHDRFGPTHKLVLGDLSYPQGGKLRSHQSHQAGRDGDVSFFFSTGAPGHLAKGTAANLDVPRNWFYLEALIEANSVEYVFVDYQIQALLYNYAKNRLHYPQAYLDRAFQFPRGRRERKGIIRHARGHANHFHIRFVSPIALANARNRHFTDPQLAALQHKMKGGHAGPGATPVPSVATAARARQAYVGTTGNAVLYMVREGDTLWSIAKKNGATVAQIRAWNDLSSTARLRIGQHLTIYRHTARHAASGK